MKTCTKCNSSKDYSLFNKDIRHKDGMTSECKECHKKAIYDWRSRNLGLVAAQTSKSKKLNRGRVAAERAKRRASKLNATPKWLTHTQRKEMEQFYRNCPKGYEVDHIIPLNGKNVAGLHIIWNLQYLTISDNRRKSNKLTSL